MFRTPTMYQAKHLTKWDNMTKFDGEDWKPARPIPFYGFQIKKRIKLAWRVFKGELDALDWGQ
jgi:hypothetical protein